MRDSVSLADERPVTVAEVEEIAKTAVMMVSYTILLIGAMMNLAAIIVALLTIVRHDVVPACLVLLGVGESFVVAGCITGSRFEHAWKFSRGLVAAKPAVSESNTVPKEDR